MSRHAKSDPRWRSDASGEVVAGCVGRLVPALPPGSRVLVAGEASAPLLAALAEIGCTPHLWLRRLGPDSAGTTPRPWPEPAACAAAILRLPRAKDEFDMMLHAAVTQVVPGGAIVVHGANDEGIRSIAVRMAQLLGRAETLDSRGHCRVLGATRPAEVVGLRGQLADWRQEGRATIDPPGQPAERVWVSYPGLFAKGALDAGTGLLVSTLDGLVGPRACPAERPRVLDFGCGTGLVAAHVLARRPGAKVDMVDVDAMAVLAAAENVPQASANIAAAVDDLAPARYDLIVSNPPIHAGRGEDYTVLARLITQSGLRLEPRGSLVLVVQARVPVEPWLAAAFAHAERLAETTRFIVWRASQPSRGKPARGEAITARRGRSNAAPARAR